MNVVLSKYRLETGKESNNAPIIWLADGLFHSGKKQPHVNSSIFSNNVCMCIMQHDIVTGLHEKAHTCIVLQSTGEGNE